jgi:hypothetical protein
MRLEREYSNATASRSSAHLFTNTDGLDLLDVRRDGSILVGPATSYSIQVPLAPNHACVSILSSGAGVSERATTKPTQRWVMGGADRAK